MLIKNINYIVAKFVKLTEMAFQTIICPFEKYFHSLVYFMISCIFQSEIENGDFSLRYVSS